MIRILTVGLGSLAIALACATAAAQDDEAVGYVYTSYFMCNAASLDLADEIATLVMAPAYDAAVEAGELTAWGWLAHHTGGKWRRAIYYVAPSIEALLDAQESVGEATEKAAPQAGRVFDKACPSHEDYIWQSVPGSGGNNLGGARGKAGFSVYYKCNSSEEARADELIAEHLGPLYQKQVDAGNLTSWGWLQHNVGGPYRRLLTATAADHKTMMKTRAAIIGEVTSGRLERYSKEFDEICGSHSDYMWNVMLETP